MRTIGEQAVWSFQEGKQNVQVRHCTDVRKAPAWPVASYIELATRVAELQFRNRDFVLFFRGQTGDFKNAQSRTTLKPSLFRTVAGRNPSSDVLIRRFEILEQAEQMLVERYPGVSSCGSRWVKRHQIVRWSILQHYEVCPTPLLDVTHSLRIAASFACDRADNEAFILVLGVPNVSGAITASAESGLQIVRLSSVCPPTALRPHIQEGYLLGEYPEMTGFKQKRLYEHYEIDFGRRLIAKFQLEPSTFWKSDAFPRVKRIALYPSIESDPVRAMAEEIKRTLPRED